jgi:hypothetical protein
MRVPHASPSNCSGLYLGNDMPRPSENSGAVLHEPTFRTRRQHLTQVVYVRAEDEQLGFARAAGDHRPKLRATRKVQFPARTAPKPHTCLHRTR